MTSFIQEISELNGLKYGKFPTQSSAKTTNENDDNYCFLRSILGQLDPRGNLIANRVSIYKQYFNESNIVGFDYSNGFKGIDVKIFEKLNKISIEKTELQFFRSGNQWKPKSIPIEIITNQRELLTY